MPSVRLSSAVRSIRFRLTLWNAAVLLVTVIAAFIAVRAGLRGAMEQEANQLLDEDLNEVSLQFDKFAPDMETVRSELNLKAEGHAPRGLFVQLFTADGKNIFNTEDTPRAIQNLPLFPAQRSVDQHRLAQMEIDARGAGKLWIRVGSSMALYETHLNQLTRAMLVVGMLLVWLSPLGGYWLADRAIRPMAELIHTADHLQPTNLQQRLPVQGTGDELDQLSKTINRLLDRIADYLDRNRQFIANAAHELRSPLAAIQTSVEVALSGDRSPAEYQELLYEVTESCGDLSALVNQLLLLAESDTVGFQRCDEAVPLDAVVKKSVEIFRGAAEEQQVELIANIQPGLWVRGAPHHLRQVLNNLIDNSLKFTPAGGEVRVDLKDDLAHRQIVLTIADTGTGIAATHLPHIFERFYRGDKSRSRDRRHRGNGLGLSICESIVREHGGTIAVASTPGEGTTFTVRFPVLAQPVFPPIDAPLVPS